MYRESYFLSYSRDSLFFSPSRQFKSPLRKRDQRRIKKRNTLYQKCSRQMGSPHIVLTLSYTCMCWLDGILYAAFQWTGQFSISYIIENWTLQLVCCRRWRAESPRRERQTMTRLLICIIQTVQFVGVLESNFPRPSPGIRRLCVMQ